MRSDEPLPGTIVGKALEPLEHGTGLVAVHGQVPGAFPDGVGELDVGVVGPAELGDPEHQHDQHHQDDIGDGRHQANQEISYQIALLLGIDQVQKCLEGCGVKAQVGDPACRGILCHIQLRHVLGHSLGLG